MARKKPNSRIIMSYETAKAKVEEYGGNITHAAKAMGIKRRTLSHWLQHKPKVITSVNRYVVTYAQNDTPVHQGFFNAVMNYCQKWNAELICYKGKYRNPTSQWEAQQDFPTWVSEVRPYLINSQRRINENLVIYPANTIPTAARPLSGYDTHTGSKSGIFPHPKIQLKAIATPGRKMPKILTTTGAITIKNYSNSKAGEKGRHHHVVGAVVVEVKNDKIFFMRHINAEEDGSFYDIAGGICKKYSSDGISIDRNGVDSYVLGDLHHPWIDDKAVNGSKDFMNRFNPKRVYLHDLIDFWRRNHHEKNNRFLNAAKAKEGVLCVKEELRSAAQFLSTFANPKKWELKIVRANHDEALDRWLNEESVDNLDVNAEYFHWISYHKHSSVKKSISGYEFMNPLEFAMSEFIDLKKLGITFLKRDDPEIHLGIEYGMHGDIGPSGAKGSTLNLSRIGVKSWIGHGHSEEITDGCYRVAVNSIIPLGYAKGANSWTHSDGLTYANGKRTHVRKIEGEYFLTD